MFNMLPWVLIFFSVIFEGVLSDDLPCAARQMEFGSVCVCNSSYCDTVARPSPLPRRQFYHYSTSQDSPGFSHITGAFSKQPQVDDDNTVVLTVNRSIQYQEILGFGGSFTDSSGMVMSTLPSAALDNLIESYFGTNGLEYSMARVPIGASDFSTRFYTYDEVPGDVNLTYFKLADEDYKYKIPFIQKALNSNPHDFKLIGGSFTCPTWMKTNDGFHSAYIKDEYLHHWAKYHIKFFDEYAKEGIKFWMMTGGNEVVIPLLVQWQIGINMVQWPSRQRDWIRYHVIPHLRASNHSHVGVSILDDMRPFARYWMDRFAEDKTAFEMVQGVALHWYWDFFFSPSRTDDLHKAYPDKLVLYTESSINTLLFGGVAVELGSWFRGAVYVMNIMENLHHWTNAYIDWNLALNTEGGPYSQLPLDAAVIINATSGEFYKNPIFYAMGHFSKFIPPGSRRVDVESNLNKTADPAVDPQLKKEMISRYLKQKKQLKNLRPDSDEPTTVSPTALPVFPPFPAIKVPQTVTYLATTNADNSSSVIVFNSENVTVTVRIEDGNLGSITTTLAAQSINTFLYWPDN